MTDLKRHHNLRNAAQEQQHANWILRRDQHLFHAGDRLTDAYVVIGGALKSCINYRNGDCQILGFHIPGDIVGYESLINGCSSCSVIALDTSCVRQLGLTRSDNTHQTLSPIPRTIIESMSGEIQQLRRQLHQERHCKTDARFAAFLLDYSHCQAERGFSRYAFRLPMARRDLAAYLGVATETLSRLFTRFRDQGLIRVNDNQLTILNPERLQSISDTSTTSPADSPGSHCQEPMTPHKSLPHST